MLLANIPNTDEDETVEVKCDCCDEGCDCGDCKTCSGEKKDDDDLLTGDDNYINEYSDGNIEVDSTAYGRTVNNDLGEDENN